MRLKKCIFADCPNTSANAPNKIFITVPQNEERRKEWFRVAEWENIPLGRNYHCCEDHFDLEKDSTNWMYNKMMGIGPIILKEDVVPRRERQKKDSFPQLMNSEKERKEDVSRQEVKPSSSVTTIAIVPLGTILVAPQKVAPELNSAPVKLLGKQPSKKRTKTVSQGTNTTLNVDNLDIFKEKKIKITDDKAVNTVASYWKIKEIDSSSSTTDIDCPLNGNYEHLAICSQSDILKQENSDVEEEINKIATQSRLFLGLPQSEYFVVDLLQSDTQLQLVHILIVLKKIKTNDSFQQLAIDFHESESRISEIFSTSLPKLATKMKEFIFWPEKVKVTNLMPHQFKTCFKDVEGIFDCFEIKIQKPSNVLEQTLTWSNYKDANIAKYIISISPNGFVNFISRKFGGHMSDLEMIKKCGYIETVPAKATLMTDRAFTPIEEILNRKGIKLVKPPSVVNQQLMTSVDIEQTKLIAACRVQLERVLRKLREFSMLQPATGIPHLVVPLLDDVVIIACAIINLQGPLVTEKLRYYTNL